MSSVPTPSSLFRSRRIGEDRYELVDWSHPEVEAKILREMSGGFDVYYDRDWPLTFRFCEFLVENPGLVAGRSVLVAAAGVGPEAVVAGRLARELWINDLSPTALDLLTLQLRRNGVAFRALPGSFAEIPLPPGLDLVTASFAIYDRDTALAMGRLLERAAARAVPVLLANQEIGGHLRAVLDRSPSSVHELHREEELQVILCGA